MIKNAIIFLAVLSIAGCCRAPHSDAPKVGDGGVGGGIASRYDTAENVQVFASSGVWTKPKNGIVTDVWCVQQKGNDLNAMRVSFATNQLDSSVRVTIGDTSSFGTYLTAFGWGAGTVGRCIVITTYPQAHKLEAR